jgi:hypothetical protein
MGLAGGVAVALEIQYTPQRVISPVLHDDDIDQLVESLEVLAVAGVKRHTCCECRCCNEQIHHAGSTCLAPGSSEGREDPSIRAGCAAIEGKRLEGGLGPLETVLSACSFVSICRRMWSSGELGHRDRADRDLERKLGCIDLIEVDDYRRVDDPALPASIVRHEALNPDRRRHRGRRGGARSRRLAPPGTAQRRSLQKRNDVAAAERAPLRVHRFA